jgi:CHRD domain
MTQTSVKKSNTNVYIAVAVIVVLAIVGVWYYMTYMTPKTTTYTVSMTGANEVPPTTSTATGQCTFTLSSDGKTLHFVLKVNNFFNITASHIHLGAVGANGPVIVPLYLGPAKTGLFTGTLAEGDITASTLVGSLQGRTIGELVEDINNSQCYVNVHTTAYPGGEIRGIILLS